MAPSVKVPVLDLHGSKDTTVPANVSLSADGWYYTTTDEIFNGGEYSDGWKAANECEGPAAHWPTQWDGEDDFYCISECPEETVVRCMWDGGHNWLFNNAKANGGLVTKFLMQWTKPSHIGGGRSVGDAPRESAPLKNVKILGAYDPSPNVTAAFAALPRTLKPVAAPPAAKEVEAVGGMSEAVIVVDDELASNNKKKRQHHYSDPKSGCRDDEEEVRAGTGTVCAYKIGAKFERGSNNSTTREGDHRGLPTPQCKLGGAAPHLNGCPFDADVPAWSKAWPICLAKSADEDELNPYRNGDFHCLLVCPCVDDPKEDGKCGPEAHAHCPHGAYCERGELRNRAHGVCTYHHDHEQQLEQLRRTWPAALALFGDYWWKP